MIHTLQIQELGYSHLVFLVVNEFPENIDQAKVELNNEELLAYFSENIDDGVQRAKENGVTGIMVIGINLGGARAAAPAQGPEQVRVARRAGVEHCSIWEHHGGLQQVDSGHQGSQADNPGRGRKRWVKSSGS